ncbi:unnamed protein product (macronuclear) [Paramecium tetraurelia]|uniref:UBA domain-containing protein n=1 Tax=Paramecium tetraurelia TaxID=5888 RepID=A0CQ72_PARTE|nr:uncharacterized protein GSPATT00009287001 [Paramecium tetraurelia]CAK72939.1 unnamed protein product [Paramecium tetraurelia]|eukprot:XP_001440336.1 hypothetical protein (macronuclear) [Paramecium tetraurelia strain d4-2]
MSRKQTRPLLILKSENDDFPFDIKDVNLNNIKQIDYFRMYNSLKMVLEKLIEEQPLQQKLQTNIDFAFQVFLQKDQTSTQQQKAGKRNQSQPFLKKEMQQLIEILSQMGFSDKQIQERLQLNPGQTFNGIGQHSEIQEGDQQSGKKQTKEKQKQGQVIDKQKLYYEQQFHSNDEPEQN